MEHKAPSLAGRAFLAVLLLIGFYVLAIGIVLALFGLLYSMAVYANRIDLRVVLFVFIGAGTVLWSIIPRRDKFIPPGPKLSPVDHPNLFAAVEEIAQETDQEPPAEIYADAQVNAWVANRGGVMGIGSKRIMGVGLPLLQGLSVSQFKAVLAHEFGHYYGGDTRLGPWIYQTRSIIGRTIVNLAQQESFLHKPFLWYGNMFLRVTHAISRQQEYAADALAARTVGSNHLINGLKRVHGSAMAYDAYWNQHVVPVLNAGYHAPLADGFARFMQSSDIAELMQKATNHALENGTQDPYDTHPPLPQRVEAVSAIEANRLNSEDEPAVSLLGNVAQLESQLFTNLAQMNGISSFAPVDWAEVGTKIYVPMWTSALSTHGDVLKGITPSQLPEIAQSVAAFVPDGWQSNTTSEIRASQFESIIGIGMAVLLHQKGWTLHSQVEKPAYFSLGSMMISPFTTIEELAAGEMQAGEWLDLALRAGIESVDLSQLQELVRG